MRGPEDLSRAADWLDRRFGLDALWLFGSEARGRAGPESDLDLAALFLRPPTSFERFEAAVDLGALLGREVDLIDLDSASPILAMQVLRHGRLLVDRNRTRRAAFFSRALSLYEDLKIVRRGAERALLERVAGGRP
jgi:hypothetical protein